MTIDDLDQLVQAYRAGDRNAFRALVEVSELEVRSFLATFAPSIDVVEEVLQMTYVIAFQRLATYELRGTFVAWLKGIARNRLRAELARRARVLQTSGDELERWLLQQGVAAMNDDAEAEAEAHALDLHRLASCLEELPRRARAIIDQRYRERRTMADLAQRFDTTAAAMAKAVQRIIHRLRRCMQRQGAGIG